MRRIGAIFPPTYPPERLRSVVEAAEAGGVGEVWLWEDCFRESAFAAAAAALAWTRTLKIGIGVTPMPLRNVALTAMEIATLERMFPRRVIPGVGHGVQEWMAQVGARVASPLTLMREYVPALRALLAGQLVSTTGRYVTLHDVRLDWPPASLPAVVAAGEGPKTLSLTGEVADGTVLPAGWSPSRLRDARSLIEQGRRTAGRAGEHSLIVFVVAAYGPDSRARASNDVARWNDGPADDLTVSGSVDDVAQAVNSFFEAGATSVILQPTSDEPDLEQFMMQTGEVSRRVEAGVSGRPTL